MHHNAMPCLAADVDIMFRSMHHKHTARVLHKICQLHSQPIPRTDYANLTFLSFSSWKTSHQLRDSRESSGRTLTMDQQLLTRAIDLAVIPSHVQWMTARLLDWVRSLFVEVGWMSWCWVAQYPSTIINQYFDKNTFLSGKRNAPPLWRCCVTHPQRPCPK